MEEVVECMHSGKSEKYGNVFDSSLNNAFLRVGGGGQIIDYLDDSSSDCNMKCQTKLIWIFLLLSGSLP